MYLITHARNKHYSSIQIQESHSMDSIEAMVTAGNIQDRIRREVSSSLYFISNLK